MSEEEDVIEDENGRASIAMSAITPDLNTRGSFVGSPVGEKKQAELFEGWLLYCGHSDSIKVNDTCVEFETSVTTLRHESDLNFFEVEIENFWNNGNCASNFFGFVTEGFQPGETSKTTIAESPHGWCVGVHEKQTEKLATYHDYNEKAQERSRPRWGATAVYGQNWSKYQLGDVFGIYYDDEAHEIWFGLNGDWRFFKGLAFSKVDETLYPAVTFARGEIRLNTKKRDFRFGPPSKEDRRRISKKVMTIKLPAKPVDDEPDLEDKKTDEVEENRDDKTDEDNFWGIQTNIGDRSLPLSNLRVTLVDSTKIAFKLGVRPGMYIQSISGDGLEDFDGDDPVGDRMKAYTKLLKTQKNEYEFVLEDRFLPGKYRFYAPKSGHNMTNPVHDRVNPKSMVLDYLHEMESVDILLLEEYIVEVDPRQPRKLLRGLIGTKVQKDRAVCLKDQMKIFSEPKGDPTGDFLRYKDLFKFTKSETIDDHTWYFLEKGGCVKHDPNNSSTSLIFGAQVRGWITVHDYESNLSYLSEDRDNQLEENMHYTMSSDDGENVRSQGYGDIYTVEQDKRVIFRDFYNRIPVRSLRPNEKVRVKKLRAVYKKHFNPTFPPGVYVSKIASELYADESMTNSVNQVAEHKHFTIMRTVMKGDIVLGETPERQFIKLYSYAAESDWVEMVYCEKEDELYELCGQLENGDWVLIEWRQGGKRPQRFLLSENEMSEKASAPSTQEVADCVVSNDPEDWGFSLSWLPWNNCSSRECYISEKKDTCTAEYIDKIQPGMLLTSVSTEKSDGTTETIELGHVSKCDNKQMETLKKSLSEKADAGEKRRLTFVMNPREGECIQDTTDTKSNSFTVGDTVKFANVVNMGIQQAGITEKGGVIWDLTAIRMSHVDKDFISKWMKTNIVEQKEEIVQLTYDGNLFGSIPIFKSLDFSEMLDIRRQENVAGYLFANDMVKISNIQNHLHFAYGKTENGWVCLKNLRTNQRKCHPVTQIQCEKKTITFDTPNEVFKDEDFEEPSKATLDGEWQTFGTALGTLTIKGKTGSATHRAKSGGGEVITEIELSGITKKGESYQADFTVGDSTGTFKMKLCDANYIVGEWNSGMSFPFFAIRKDRKPYICSNKWGFDVQMVEGRSSIVSNVQPGSIAAKNGINPGWTCTLRGESGDFGFDTNVHTDAGDYEFTIETPQGRCVVRKTVVVYMKTDSGMKEVCILEQGSTMRVVKQDEDGFCEVTSAVLKQIISSRSGIDKVGEDILITRLNERPPQYGDIRYVSDGPDVAMEYLRTKATPICAVLTADERPGDAWICENLPLPQNFEQIDGWHTFIRVNAPLAGKIEEIGAKTKLYVKSEALTTLISDDENSRTLIHTKQDLSETNEIKDCVSKAIINVANPWSYPIVQFKIFGKTLYTTLKSMHELKQHTPSIEENKTYFVSSSSHDENHFVGYETPSTIKKGEKNLETGKLISPGEDYDVDEIWFANDCVKVNVPGVGWIIRTSTIDKLGSEVLNRVDDLQVFRKMIAGEYDNGRKVGEDLLVTKTTSGKAREVGVIRILNRHQLELRLRSNRAFKGDYTVNAIFWHDGKIWVKSSTSANANLLPEQNSSMANFTDERWMRASWKVQRTSQQSSMHQKSYYRLDGKFEIRNGVEFYDTTTGEFLYTIHESISETCVWNNSRLVFVSYGEGGIYLVTYEGVPKEGEGVSWDSKHTSVSKIKVFENEDNPSKMTISQDMKYLACCASKNDKQTPRIIKIDKAKDQKFEEVDFLEAPVFDSYYKVRFCPNNKFLIVTGFYKNEKGQTEDAICVFDVDNDFKLKGQFVTDDLALLRFSKFGSFMTLIGTCEDLGHGMHKTVCFNTQTWTFDGGVKVNRDDLLLASFYPPHGYERVMELSLSEDEEFLGLIMSMGWDTGPRRIQIRSTRSWQLLKDLQLYDAQLVQFTPKNQLMLSCNRNGSVGTSVLRIPENPGLDRLKCTDSKPTDADVVSYEKNGETINVVAYNDGDKLRLVNLDTGDTLTVNLKEEDKKESFGCQRISISPNGRFVCACAKDAIKIIDVVAVKEQKEPQDQIQELEHGGNDCSFIFKGGKTYLAVAVERRVLMYYYSESGKAFKQVKEGKSSLSMEGDITRVKLTPSALIYTGKAAVLKVVTNYTQPKQMKVREVPLTGFVNDIAYTPDFNLMAVGMGHSIVFFDTHTWKILQRDRILDEENDVEQEKIIKLKYPKENICYLDFSWEGSILLCGISAANTWAGTQPEKVEFFDITTFEKLKISIDSRAPFMKFSTRNEFLLIAEKTEKNRIKATKFPPPSMDSVMRSNQVIKNGPTLTYLASFIYKDTSLVLPKNTMNFWDYNPFQAWIFPDLFSEILWKGLEFDKIGVDDNDDTLSSIQQKALEQVLLSITKQEHWVDLINVDAGCFQKILLTAASLKDPKVGKIFTDLIMNMQLLPIELSDEDHYWKEISKHQLLLHKQVLPFTPDGQNIWETNEYVGFDRDDLHTFVIPVKGFADLQFLEEIKGFITLWKPSLFDSDVMGYAVDIWWENVKWQFRQELMQYIILLFTYTITSSDVMDIQWDFSDTSTNGIFLSLCAYLSCINCLAFIRLEMMQMRNLGFGYLREQPNMFQLTLIISIIASYIWGATATGNAKENNHPNILSSLAVLMLYGESFYYLRGYDTTSWLITVLYSIVMEARFFILLLAIIVGGFTTSFKALGVGDTYWLSFVEVFLMGFVGADIEFDELVNADVGRVLYISLVFFLVVVCLNAIIAFMGDSYTKVQESKKTAIRYGRMQLFLEMTEMWTSNKRRNVAADMQQWIHVLRPIEGNSDEWEGQTTYLKEHMNNLIQPVKAALIEEKSQANLDKRTIVENIQQIKKQTKNEIEGLKAEHQKQIAALTKEVTDLRQLIVEEFGKLKQSTSI